MRDAVTFEGLGIPTAILVNDVFEPIAHATAALLELPGDYVARNIVWLPHPTSNLTAAAAAALVDERIEQIRAALVGREQPPLARASEHASNGAPSASAAVATPEPVDDGNRASETLEIARGIVEGLAQSLRADGADLVLTSFDGGVLAGELRIGELTCDDGSCIMPTDALERMVDAMVRPKIATLASVTLHEIRLES
jgi:hypothetical protein